MERAQAVNTHPRFIEALADAVLDVWRGTPVRPLADFRLSEPVPTLRRLHNAAMRRHTTARRARSSLSADRPALRQGARADSR